MALNGLRLDARARGAVVRVHARQGGHWWSVRTEVGGGILPPASSHGGRPLVSLPRPLHGDSIHSPADLNEWPNCGVCLGMLMPPPPLWQFTSANGCPCICAEIEVFVSTLK